MEASRRGFLTGLSLDVDAWQYGVCSHFVLSPHVTVCEVDSTVYSIDVLC